MKKRMLLTALALCLSLTACGQTEESPNTSGSVSEEPAAVTVTPLPDTTMENLTDAILSVSLEEGSAYIDDTGKLQMDVKIYTYDKYDMADISALNVGDILVTHAGQVEITSLERSGSGLLCINGGLEEGGLELFTNESGIFYEVGFNDAKSWYEAGEATLRVSADFQGYDNADPDQGELIIYPGDFLIEGAIRYDFTPYNTTIRVEEGQVAELNRVYVP